MAHESEKPLSEDEFKRFGTALLQVSKEELAEIVTAEQKDERPKKGRPRKKTGD